MTETIDRNVRDINPIIKGGGNKSRSETDLKKENISLENSPQILFKHSFLEFGESLENITVVLKAMNISRIEIDQKLKDFESILGQKMNNHDFENRMNDLETRIEKNVIFRRLMIK